MNLPSIERIHQLHRHRAAAVVVALLAALALLLMTDAAGQVSWIGLVASVVAGAIVLGNSDSYSGLLLLAAMIVQWLDSGMDAGSWWVVPAAWLVLVAHVAVTLAASGPQQAPIPREVLSLWLPRTILVGLATTCIGILALLIEPTNNEFMPYGVALALLALAVAVLVTIGMTSDSTEQLRPDEPTAYRSISDRLGR